MLTRVLQPHARHLSCGCERPRRHHTSGSLVIVTNRWEIIYLWTEELKPENGALWYSNCARFYWRQIALLVKHIAREEMNNTLPSSLYWLRVWIRSALLEQLDGSPCWTLFTSRGTRLLPPLRYPTSWPSRNFIWIVIAKAKPHWIQGKESISCCQAFDRFDTVSSKITRKQILTGTDFLFTGLRAFLNVAQGRSGALAATTRPSLVWGSPARPAVLTLIDWV